MEDFRILEITQPSEIHVTANQLTVEQVIEPKKNGRYAVRILRITEKQFCKMGLYQFERDFQEAIVGINDYIML